MRCSYLLASAVWLATAWSLPSSPPANQPAEQAKGKVDITTWGIRAGAAIFGAGLVSQMAKQVREDHERDLIRRIGTHFRLELRGLDGLLDKQKRPTAYKCMRGCIITEFEKRFSADPNGYFRSALGFAYVICQKKDRCNLDHDDRINPYNYKKVVPSSAQGAERQDRNVNEFELLTGRASNAVHRFAAHAGKTWNAAFAQGQRLKKAALSQEGELEKAWAKDKVLQLVRHEG